MPNRTVLDAKRLGIYSCRTDDTLEEVARRIAEEDISGMVVVDDQGYLAGVITRIDLLRAYGPGVQHDARIVIRPSLPWQAAGLPKAHLQALRWLAT